MPSSARTVSAVFACSLAAILAITAPTASESQLGERVEASGARHELSFFAGAEVRVSGTATDDIYAAGAEISIEGAQLADVIAAGGFVDFRSASAEDLTLAGGDIEIAGEIADDLVAAGGRLRLERAASVGGDALLAGGTVEVAAPIGGALRVTAGRVVLNAPVAGNAELRAGRIVLESDTRIAGDLVYGSREEPEIAEGAVIEGEIRRVPFMEREMGFWNIVAAILFGILVWLAAVVSMILLAATLQTAAPALLRDAEQSLGRQPWASLGLGFSALVATPVAIALLFSTAVGIPIALLALALYAIAMALGLATAGKALGTVIARALGRRGEAPGFWPQLRRTALGLAALAVLVLVPFVGQLAVLLALVLGIGAALIGAWHKLRAPLAA